MLFNMQTCIILQFEQKLHFCAIPQLPQVFGCPNFTPFDYSYVFSLGQIKNNKEKNSNYKLSFQYSV